MSEMSTTQTSKLSRLSVIQKIVLGIILIGIAVRASLSASVVLVFATGNNFLWSDSQLYIIFICFTISWFISFVYFSFQKFQGRSLTIIHVTIAIVFLAFFIFEFINVRRNQVLVLNTYQQFNHAIRQGNYESAYELMSPEYRQKSTVDDLAHHDDFLWYAREEVNTMYAVDCKLWKNEAVIIFSTSSPTFWKRPPGAIFLYLKFIDGKWLFTGESDINGF